MTATMARPKRAHVHVDEHGRAWPTDRLIEVTGKPLQQLAELAGYSRRTGHRWARCGTFSDAWADGIACRLGLNPREVWTDWDDGVLELPNESDEWALTGRGPLPGRRSAPMLCGDDSARRPAARTREGRRRLTERWAPRARERRLAAGLSQDDVAERAGTNRKTVGRLERGEFFPTPETRRAIAAALGTTPEELFPC